MRLSVSGQHRNVRGHETAAPFIAVRLLPHCDLARCPALADRPAWGILALWQGTQTNRYVRGGAGISNTRQGAWYARSSNVGCSVGTPTGCVGAEGAIGETWAVCDPRDRIVSLTLRQIDPIRCHGTSQLFSRFEGRNLPMAT
jgi:hypothetical protein